MSFNPGKFNPEGSISDRAKGDRIFTYDAGDDSLLDVVADNFFLSEQERLPVGRIIRINSLAGEYVASVTVSDPLSLNISIFGGGVQNLTNAGEGDIINRTTFITTTGAATITLADGAVGQIKTFILVAQAGLATVTPAKFIDGVSVTLDVVGDGVTFQFYTTGWTILTLGGGSII